MGRKPNALILHYFHRGPKLEDASNRYQHTCKACGEVFPKGRIDSLQNHLTRKCPALSLTERTHVILQIHNVPPGAASTKKEAKVKENKSINLPAQSHTPQQTFDGLNVLAEASRQVGQVERRTSQTYPPPNDDSINMAIDPALDVFPHSFPNTFDHELGAFTQSNVAQSHSTVAIPPLPHLSTEQTEDDHSHAHPISSPQPEHTDVSMTEQPDQDLSAIAANASELLPPQPVQAISGDSRAVHGVAGQSNGDVDAVEASEATGAIPEEQEGHDVNINDADPQPADTTTESHEVATSQQEEGSPFGVSRPQEQWINFDGPNFHAFYEEMQRNQPRDRPLLNPVTPLRPIAVRGGDTKPGEFNEFTLDARNPPKSTRQKFSAERRKEVQDIRKKGACLRCRMLRKPCSIDTPCVTCRGVESARLWKEPCMRVRITEMFDVYNAGLYASLSYKDINLVTAQLQFEHSHGQIQMALAESFADPITVRALQGRVDNSAVGIPLAAADNLTLGIQDVRLLDGENADMVAKTAAYLQAQGAALQQAESSHIMRCSLAALSTMFSESPKDELLDETLQLWTATHVLVDLEMRWRMMYHSAVTEEDAVIDLETDNLSYQLIQSQLRSYVEKRAAHLNKKVLQNLEKKLMHNKRDFDIFLVALILLNCAERTSWLFRCWETPEYLNRWPLERQPDEYWTQGEHFAEILHMVLKMRVVPPKTSPRPDNGVLVPVDSTSPKVIEWFDTVQLTVDFLNERQNAEFDPADSRSWDIKYAARILLPQNCHT